MEELAIGVLLSGERTFQANRCAKATCESMPECFRNRPETRGGVRSGK